MNDKIIINVGRQLGSGGFEIGKLLAKEFGAKFLDRELLNLAAKESGFSEKLFKTQDEHRGFMKHLFHFSAPIVGTGGMYNNSISPEALFQFQSDAIRKVADEGSCVIVGRCADYVLRDYPNVFNVFITADMKDRIECIRRIKMCDAETARKLIDKKENEREKYYNFYTGKKWGAAQSYDLCINSSLLGVEATAQFIIQFIRQRLGR